MTKSKPKSGEKCQTLLQDNNKGNKTKIQSENIVKSVDNVDEINGINNGINSTTRVITNNSANAFTNNHFNDPSFYLLPMMNPNIPQRILYQIQTVQAYNNRCFGSSGSQKKYGTTWYCKVEYCTVRYYTVKYCTARYSVKYCTARDCTAKFMRSPTLETQNFDMSKKLLYLQYRSMRENLLCTGIQENIDQNSED